MHIMYPFIPPPANITLLFLNDYSFQRMIPHSRQIYWRICVSLLISFSPIIFIFHFSLINYLDRTYAYTYVPTSGQQVALEMSSKISNYTCVPKYITYAQTRSYICTFIIYAGDWNWKAVGTCLIPYRAYHPYCVFSFPRFRSPIRDHVLRTFSVYCIYVWRLL